MTTILQIHPENPQPRLLKQAAEMLHDNAVMVYPTDSSYGIGCRIGAKEPLERIRRLKRLSDKHLFTLVCQDLSELGTFAKVDNWAFRKLKAHTPGPYTFLLPATREVPRRILHPKRKVIGLRIPDHPITHMLLQVFGEPILSTTAQLEGEELPLTDPQDIIERYEGQVDLIIDGGMGHLESTTMIDMTQGEAAIVREGLGDPTAFLD